MNYTISDRGRRVLARAREEVIRRSHDQVGVAHIALALLREKDGVIRRLGAVAQELAQRIDAAQQPGTAGVVLRPDRLPYAPQAKQVLEEAMKAAHELRSEVLGTEHLLLGVLRSGDAVVVPALEAHGVTSAAVRGALAELPLPGERGATPQKAWLPSALGTLLRGGRDAATFAITIDDASSASIYEQIVAQVQEAVATGRATPGTRLPTVRKLADELDIAPGTVARAYSELERLGVVVTEGARGTRVAERPARALPDDERTDTLTGLLRPVVVAAFHLGAKAGELRAALERAMAGIYEEGAAREG